LERILKQAEEFKIANDNNSLRGEDASHIRSEDNDARIRKIAERNGCFVTEIKNTYYGNMQEAIQVTFSDDSEAHIREYGIEIIV
tara:strand:- start:1102 stop:1356 length:255 start_codon:yes stop_codon:yes gene_type:complete